MNTLNVQAHVQRKTFTLNASFQAPLSQIIALFGPSGAGKSMLLSAIAGLVRSSRGRIALAGDILSDADIGLHMPAQKRDIGVVFQDARLFPHLSVRGNLDFAFKRAPHQRLSVAEAAEIFHIAHLLQRPIRNLSGGERSRVALARAVLSAPRLLLLDEPFAALDGVRRRQFLELLRNIHQQFSLPMLIVTHQIEDAAFLADFIVALEAGKVAAAGPLAEMTSAPAFRNLLDPHDYGGALRTPSGGQRWLRADALVLATSRPQGLAPEHVLDGVVSAITPTAGRSLAQIQTDRGSLCAHAPMHLAPGQTVWIVTPTQHSDPAQPRGAVSA